MISIQTSTKIFAKLKAGSRAWFWFCPELPIEHARLLITSFERDPGQEKLQKMINRMDPPSASTQHTGVLHIGEDGVFRFASIRAEVSNLIALATWVKHHLQNVPNLALLKNAEIISITNNGSIFAVFEDKFIWKSLPSLPIRGSIAYTAKRLKAMPVKQEAWFWLTDQGPGNKPFLSLYPISKDVEGEIFAEECANINKRSTQKGKEMIGILRNDKNYGLCFICQGKGAHWQEMIKSLIDIYGKEHSAFTLLEESSLVRMRKGKIIDRLGYIKAIKPTQIRVAELLSSIEEEEMEEKLYFWFQSKSQNHTSCLIMEENLQSLKDIVKKQKGTGKTIRGMVRKTTNYLEFRSTNPMKNFLEQLIEWTRENISQWPSLRLLQGSRIIITSKSGAIIERHKADDLWKTIETQQKQ